MSLVVAAALLVVVAAVAVSVAGVLLGHDAFDRLHYLGPAVLIGGPALVVAVVAEHGVGVAAGRTALVVIVLAVAGPVMTHAIARAGLARGDAARLRGDELDGELP